MKLWVHMGHERLAELQSGVLHQNNEFTRRENPYWAIPYAWMIGEMEKRIGPRPDGVRVPIWGWHSHYGEHKRPDLRVAMFTGCNDWLVGVDVDPGRVVLSDFQLWHHPLNVWYLPKSNEEAKLIEEHWNNNTAYVYPDLPWEHEYEAKIREFEGKHGDRLKAVFEASVAVYGESWEQIFDLGYSVPGYADEKPELQATMWELRKEDIFEVVRINRRSRANDVEYYNKWNVRRKNKEDDPSFSEESYVRWDEIIEWGVNG